MASDPSSAPRSRPAPVPRVGDRCVVPRRVKILGLKRPDRAFVEDEDGYAYFVPRNELVLLAAAEAKE